jgi:hypothetical protein
MKFIDNLNVIQTISVVGVVLSLLAHLFIVVVNKDVETFWAIYPTWVFIFFIGTLIKKYVKDDEHHHH